MTNGQLDTGFVVTWLTAHSEDFYASAPETHDGIAVEAQRIDDELHFYEKCNVRPNNSETVQLRNDWTIRFDSGEPVHDDVLSGGDTFVSFVRCLLEKRFRNAIHEFSVLPKTGGEK
jgi:hypothetical protein